MRNIPGHTLFDSTLALMNEGYCFIANRCQRYRAPVFVTRLLLRRTLCIRGEMAAKLFYDQCLFSRTNASAYLAHNTRLGAAETQLLRKQLFGRALQAGQAERLVSLAEQQWLAALQRWEGQPHVVMLPEIETLLCKAVCRWAGIPLHDDEASERRQQLAALIDGGCSGWAHLAAWRGHLTLQRWARRLIAQQRAGELVAPVDSALALINRWRGGNGKVLPGRVAAAESLELLGQTVAVARFIVFALLELHRHPEWQLRLAHNDEWLRPFAREVRRLYSFQPFIAARVRQDFAWQGYMFQAGSRVLLDLYGTSRDPVTWQQTEAFMPERFIAWPSGAYGVIPQDDVSAECHPHCPSEDLAVMLIESALRLFCRRMHYRVAEQAPGMPSRRMPVLPASCLVLSEIAAVHGGAGFAPGGGRGHTLSR